MGRIAQVLGSFLLVWLLLFVIGNQANSLPSREVTRPHATTTLTATVHIPLMTRSDTFYQNRPIWVKNAPSSSHAVALFRRNVDLRAPLEDAKLLIFADTRYELWVDGTWIGRGPARFSSTTKECDTYCLGDLQPGYHLIAVLVQWAPNTRRSESQAPHLLGHVEGMTSNGQKVVARTGPGWRGVVSDAWRRDSVAVHAWNLIGPTELLDLRKLPPGWMTSSFSDDEWPAAEPQEHSTGGTYQPRSIPLLDQVPRTATVIDRGRLSPEYAVGELSPSLSAPHRVLFRAFESAKLVIETLTETEGSRAGFPSLDGTELDWEQAGSSRPDVFVASVPVEPGTHSLEFADIPPEGLTFGLSARAVSTTTIPFEQGVHAGRRLLLAEPLSSTDAVSVRSTDGLTMTFEKGPAYAVLDLGRVVHGRLEADVSGPAGTVVDIGWDERLLAGTLRPLPYPGSLHPEWNQTDSWVLDGTTRSISTIDSRAGRYVLIAVWNDNSVELQDVRIYEEKYPTVQRGEFSSSRALLNQIWQVGVETLYPNMTDAYTDTPWRERGQWWGDAYVEQHVNEVAIGDTALLRRGLLLMAEEFHEGRPPGRAPHGGGEHLLDYGMLWVQSLYDHHRLTGERQLLREVYPVLKEFLTYLHQYEDLGTGLLSIPYGHWWETALVDWRGPHSRYGQSTALNALYYGTLMDACQVAEAIGNAKDAHAWRQRAQRVKRQINAHLYLPSQQRYVTSIYQGETFTPSVHAQAWAIAYGVVPDDSVAEVASALLELLPRTPDSGSSEIGIYGMFWVLKALGQAGQISEALNLIEAYYGGLLDLEATTWWEGFGSHLSYRASLSHGWGGAPTWFMTSYALGARRSGTDGWVVEPALDVLSDANGILPIQDGLLSVHWERPSCSDAYLELTVPSGTPGELVISSSPMSTTLTLNDQVIWIEGTALIEGPQLRKGDLLVPLSDGNHTVHIHWDCEPTFLPLMVRTEANAGR